MAATHLPSGEREGNCAAAQAHCRSSIHSAHEHGIIAAYTFSTFEKDEVLAVRRDVSDQAPVKPGEVSFHFIAITEAKNSEIIAFDS